eukprot:TRINITY_DN40697_c0_g1_i1.p2 TRINITY_DN40697_c0_g1~~TRINITY_DN40697_c0_g1_i1.p2  ORF type:complete len:123 (-),score=27.17 TRINITY_DN40697_c0_g1_i1:433-801(-)
MNSPKVLFFLGEYLRGEREEPPWEHMGVSDPPQIGGQKINLKMLFQSVGMKGGFAEVGRKRAWSQICEEMQLDDGSAQLLRDEYLRFLYKYERQEDLQKQSLQGSRQAAYRQNFRTWRGESG